MLRGPKKLQLSGTGIAIIMGCMSAYVSVLSLVKDHGPGRGVSTLGEAEVKM